MAGERGTVDDGAQREWSVAERATEHSDLSGHHLLGRDVVQLAWVRADAELIDERAGGCRGRVGDIARSLGPLCTIARWKRPVAAGTASNVETFAPPPDSPKIVTFDGSPPKARRSPAPTQCHDEVERADVARHGVLVAEDLSEVEVTERAEAMVDGDDDDVVARRQRGAIEHRHRSRADRVGTAMQ